MFTGREYVSQFGIYEYRNRAYHPGLGRFMSEDPKGFDAGDNNFFRYCANDPIDHTDAMGLATDPVTIEKQDGTMEDKQGTNGANQTATVTAKGVEVKASDPSGSKLGDLNRQQTFDSLRSSFDRMPENSLGGFAAAERVSLEGPRTTDHVYTKEEISEIEPGDFSDTTPLFSPLDFLGGFVAKLGASTGSKLAIGTASHAMRRVPQAMRGQVAAAIAKDIAQKGAPSAGRDIQRIINVAGKQIEYRAHGLPNGTTKVSSVVEGSFGRDVSIPSNH